MRTRTPPGELIPARGGRSTLSVSTGAESAFPVTPMLDMAFQLLAFFLLIYQPSSPETRIDLVLPAEPAQDTAVAVSTTDDPSRPTPAPAGTYRPVEPTSSTLDENTGPLELNVRVRADDAGMILYLELAGAPLDSPRSLTTRLQRYQRLLPGRAVRVRLAADDNLLHAESARLIAAIHNAGVSSIKLAAPTEPPTPLNKAQQPSTDTH